MELLFHFLEYTLFGWGGGKVPISFCTMIWKFMFHEAIVYSFLLLTSIPCMAIS